MNIKDILLYKTDELSGQMRLSKTKIIALTVFLLVFIFVSNSYFTSPEYSNTSPIILLISGVIVGLIFAIPVYTIGWLITKKLFGSKAPIPNNDYDYKNTSQNQQNPNLDFQNINSAPNFDNNGNRLKVYNYKAKKFKKAIEDNDSRLAKQVLEDWNENDANSVYASIIYDGMPPTNLSIEELNRRQQLADGMEANDESLRQWYQKTAQQVINLNKQKVE